MGMGGGVGWYPAHSNFRANPIQNQKAGISALPALKRQVITSKYPFYQSFAPLSQESIHGSSSTLFNCDRLRWPGWRNQWTKPHAGLLKFEHSVTLGTKLEKYIWAMHSHQIHWSVHLQSCWPQTPGDETVRKRRADVAWLITLRWLFIVFFVQICIQDSGCSVHRRTTIFGSVEGP